MPRRRKVQIEQAEIVRLFAERLRAVRRSRNLSQAELAQRAQVPASYISDLEKAKSAPGIDLVDRLARALEATVGELLPLEPTTETTAELQARVRELIDELLQTADRDVLGAVDSLLTLFRELSTRRR